MTAFAIPGRPEEVLPICIRVHTRARRLTVRVDALAPALRVVVPPGIGDAEIHRFLQRHRDWISDHLAALPPARPFVSGTVVPVLGQDREIRHDPRRQRRVVLEPEALVVGGEASFVPRRIRDFLRTEARQHLEERAGDFAGRIGREPPPVMVRDTRSRWGSCSARGRLSFSWRLILAPSAVMDYVVAHEVAHLVEMNHSPRFWTQVHHLVPGASRARDWLRCRGAELLRYG